MLIQSLQAAGVNNCNLKSGIPMAQWLWLNMLIYKTLQDSVNESVVEKVSTTYYQDTVHEQDNFTLNHKC